MYVGAYIKFKIKHQHAISIDFYKILLPESITLWEIGERLGGWGFSTPKSPPSPFLV